jgi:hypothetical protein
MAHPDVQLLQVTGKLDGADSGMDISVSELDQHLHKVLEVRAQLAGHVLPASQQQRSGVNQGMAD